MIEGEIRLEKTSDDTFTFTRRTADKLETSTNKRLLAPEPVSKKMLEEFEYFIGDWKTQQDDGGTATWSFKWGHNKSLIENKLQSKNANGEIVLSHTGMLIWDVANRRFLNQCVAANGNPVDFVWEKKADDEWSNWIRNSSGEGGVVKIIDADSWSLTWETTTQTYVRQ